MEEIIYKAPERVDTANYKKVEQELSDLVSGGNCNIVFDMEDVKYISSAGLRVLLTIYKEVKDSGGLTLSNVPDSVREILDMTGFSGMLAIR